MSWIHLLLLACSTVSLGVSAAPKAATTSKTTTKATTMSTSKTSSATTTVSAPACTSDSFVGQGCFQATYNVLCGHSVSGGNGYVSTPNVWDFYSCVNLCDHDVNCYGASYNIGTGACVLLDGILAPVVAEVDPNFDAAIYVRGTGSSSQCGNAHAA